MSKILSNFIEIALKGNSTCLSADRLVKLA
jgi:hypothetical protein